jgi:hypothetical protein
VEVRLKLGAIVGLHDETRKGNRRSTSSMNWMAVRCVHASNSFSTRRRVQSSIAMNW